MTDKQNFEKDISVPSKEQIIVDGVDVSGCEYACNTAFGKNGCKHPMMKNIYCSKNPNCYYKQLARKEQEYNLLVRTNKQHVNLLDQLNNKYIDLEQECEELKDYARRQENQREVYYKEFLKKDKALEELKKELNRYRKALEDIEEATKKISNYLNIGCDITKCEDCNHFEHFCINQCVCYLIEQGDSILDIINKAKKE